MLIRPSVIAVAAVLLATVPAAAQSVPTLNVEPTCRNIPDPAMTLQRDSQACMKSENEARAQLQKDWASFPVADRAVCVQTATMGGTASYVELITCLEMRRDARNLPKDQLTRINELGR